MPGVHLPELSVEDNAEGWGPLSEPPQFKDVPFMPYSKGDRLGRIADFGQMASQRQYQGRYRDQQSGPAVFNFEKAEEEETFQLIDTKPVKKPTGPQRGRGQGRGWGAGGRGWGQPADPRAGVPPEPVRGGMAARGRGGRFGQQGRGWGYRPWDQPRTQYSSSVEIRPEWHVVGDQINFSALQKLNTQVEEPAELAASGELCFYDKAADRVTPKVPAKLRRTAQRTRSATTSEDPIMRKLAAEGAGQVFMTDALLTTLMCAPRSVFPWDIVITRRGGRLFFDKRANSSLDFLTNGETAPDPLPEEKDNVNGVQALGVEATAVNQAFREQVLSGGERHSLGQPCPPGMPSHAHAGYKYRKWTLGGVELVVRCEIDAAIRLGEGVQLVAVHALNEFDPKWAGVDWRQKLENQRGAVLATELKNNANKMAKWTAAALLSGVDLIKLGYLTRAGPKDNRNHLVLGTQAVKPRDFAQQMNLNMDNCWGIVRALLDLCVEKLDADGKYLLVKDPNKPQLRIYAIPAEEAIVTQYTEAAEGEEEEEAAEGAGGKGGEE